MLVLNLESKITALYQIPGRELINFYDGVIMSDHFLRSSNMLTKFFKDPKYAADQFSEPQKITLTNLKKSAFY